MASPSFGNRCVLCFESRRAKEIESLVATFGGRALVAPAVRELPLDSDDDAIALCDGIAADQFDAVIFLTGVGARALVDAVDRAGRRDELLAALTRTRVIVRGPKPSAVMRELEIPVWVNAPEPNTWREVIAAIDARAHEWPVKDARIAVQEYGVSNPDLLEALRERGAQVTAAPTYQWAMPEDIEPLREAARALIGGRVDVLVITSGIQLVHFWRIVREMGVEQQVTDALSRVMIASIGPSASAEIRRHGLMPAFEPSHPKMGLLIREAAQRFDNA